MFVNLRAGRPTSNKTSSVTKQPERAITGKGFCSMQESCHQSQCTSSLGVRRGSFALTRKQHRLRKCSTDQPGPNLCQAPSMETWLSPQSPDLDSELNSLSVMSGLEGDSSSVSVSVLVLLWSCFATLIVGAVIAVFVHKRHKRPRIHDSPHCTTSKQKPYVTVTVPLKEMTTPNVPPHFK